MEENGLEKKENVFGRHMGHWRSLRAEQQCSSFKEGEEAAAWVGVMGEVGGGHCACSAFSSCCRFRAQAEHSVTCSIMVSGDSLDTVLQYK